MEKPSAKMIALFSLKDGAREFLSLPVWWYSDGLGRMLRWTFDAVKGAIRFFDLNIWIKNLFVPMYGEESLSGRTISFGVRLFMVLIRSVGVAAVCVGIVGLAILYLLILPFLIMGILGQLLGIVF